MTVRNFNLVVPLAPQRIADATDMRTTDTSGQLDLFVREEHQHGSGAVSGLIGDPQLHAEDLRPGDVESTNGNRTATTTIMRGPRTSATATRTTTTRTTCFRLSPFADGNAAHHADFSLELVVLAHIDCREAKRGTASCRTFEMQQEVLLYDLACALRNGTYTPGRSICFVITRPRFREVWAAPYRDRVVHHLLYNRIADRFHRSFIADTCACVPGRGTLYAARRLEHHVRSASQNWSRPVHYLKCDIANFFVSINKPILRDLLARRVHEPEWMDLTEQILFHDPRENYALHSPPALMARVPPHKSLLNQPIHLGLPIGNLSSQFFANVYLDLLDQFIKHRLRIRHYVRYVDDFVLLDESPRRLNQAKAAIEDFLGERLALRLNPTKTILQPVARGVDMVGQVLKPWRRTLRRRTFNDALHRVATIEADRLFETANSYFGTLRQTTHSHHDRCRLANLLRDRGHCVDGNLTKAYRKHL